MNELALFAGIGGISKGLRDAGVARCVCSVECEAYPASILIERQASGDLDPHPIWDDACTFDGRQWVGCVDIITGGFPCQDISNAGKRIGITGERSGLWKQYARIIDEIKPPLILIENVSALLNRGLNIVLADLHTLGYDAWWNCIPASAIGAPHQRDRIWILAWKTDLSNPDSTGQQNRREQYRRQQTPNGKGERGFSGYNTLSEQLARFRDSIGKHQWQHDPADIPDSERLRLERAGELGGMEETRSSPIRERSESASSAQDIRSPSSAAKHGVEDLAADRTTESFVGRVAHGIPNRVERLKALGNAVVPQTVHYIAKEFLT